MKRLPAPEPLNTPGARRRHEVYATAAALRVPADGVFKRLAARGTFNDWVASWIGEVAAAYGVGPQVLTEAPPCATFSIRPRRSIPRR